jgi:hypothetical protein
LIFLRNRAADYGREPDCDEIGLGEGDVKQLLLMDADKNGKIQGTTR